MTKYCIVVFLLCFVTGKNLFSQHSDFKLIWSDDFNKDGLPDSLHWNYDVGGHGWGNDELEYYTDHRLQNARVENGKLIIEARKEEYKGKHYTSARLVTNKKGDWLYGRFEIRAKLPRGRGTWPAGWMLSSDWTYGAWPESGEIDIMEHVGWDMGVNHVSCHSLDYYWKKNTQKTATINLKSIDSTFYTYAIDWRPDRIDAYVDDSLYFTCKKEAGWSKWPFDKPFYLLLNIAVGGAWGSVKGIDSTIYPQRLEIDFVKVYKYIEPKDTIVPSAPENLKSVISDNKMLLLWDAGYDNYGVKEYRVFCNGKEVGKSIRQSIEIDKLKPSKLYKVKVVSVDWEGNESAPLEKTFQTLHDATIVVPGRVEAENYSNQNGVLIEPTIDTNGGVDVCWIEPADWIEYNINVIQSGDYTIDYRAATERIDGKIELYNSKNIKLSTVSINNTHGWQNWNTYSTEPLHFDAGKQKIKLIITGDRSSLNWLEFKQAK